MKRTSLHQRLLVSLAASVLLALSAGGGVGLVQAATPTATTPQPVDASAPAGCPKDAGSEGLLVWRDDGKSRVNCATGLMTDDQGNLAVGGSVRVGASALACGPDGLNAGAIRFNKAIASFEGCDGTAWGQLTKKAQTCQGTPTPPVSIPVGQEMTNITADGTTRPSNTVVIVSMYENGSTGPLNYTTYMYCTIQCQDGHWINTGCAI